MIAQEVVGKAATDARSSLDRLHPNRTRFLIASLVGHFLAAKRNAENPAVFYIMNRGRSALVVFICSLFDASQDTARACITSSCSLPDPFGCESVPQLATPVVFLARAWNKRMLPVVAEGHWGLGRLQAKVTLRCLI